MEIYAKLLGSDLHEYAVAINKHSGSDCIRGRKKNSGGFFDEITIMGSQAEGLTKREKKLFYIKCFNWHENDFGEHDRALICSLNYSKIWK